MDGLDPNAAKAEATLARAKAFFANFKNKETASIKEIENKKAGGALLAECDNGTESTALDILDNRNPDLTMRKLQHTALMLASKNNFIEVVKKLIKMGADINAKTLGGTTALIWACDNYNPEIALALIGAGADVNASDMGGSVLYQCETKKERMKDWHFTDKTTTIDQVIEELKRRGAISIPPSADAAAAVAAAAAAARGGARRRKNTKSRKARRNRNKQSHRQRRRF